MFLCSGRSYVMFLKLWKSRLAWKNKEMIILCLVQHKNEKVTEESSKLKTNKKRPFLTQSLVTIWKLLPQECIDAGGPYWFKLEMGKLMYITDSCQTHRNCTWFGKSWSPGKGLWRSLMHACCSPPSASALGHWDRTVGQGSLWWGMQPWAGLLCLSPGKALFLLRVM